MGSISNIEDLIKYLDGKYPLSHDSVNYGDLLRSMSESDSIEKILSACNRVNEKTSSWDPYLVYESYICSNPELLTAYYNECVRDWYKRCSNLSLDTYCKAYINIRPNKNAFFIKKEINRLAQKRGLDVVEVSSELDRNLKQYYSLKREIDGFEWGSNGYLEILPKIKEIVPFLLDNHYIYSKEFNSLFYDEYCADLVLKSEENLKKNKEKEEEKREKNISILIAIIAIIVIIVFIIILPPIGSEVFNWIFAIIIILALIKQ